MALRLAGEDIGIQEKIETILYSPGVQDTGDLEAATKSITTASEASGLGNADYSASLTLPKPDDARLVIKRIAARLQVTRDSGTSNNLYCRVYVDVQDATHRLFDVDVQAAALQATALTSGTIFDLLKDGAEHTFYFFFWVDSGDSVISLVELWEGVGKNGSSGASTVASLNHSGLAQLTWRGQLVGSGQIWAGWKNAGSNIPIVAEVVANTWGYSGSIVLNNPDITVEGSVVTDLVYLAYLGITLRRMQ